MNKCKKCSKLFNDVRWAEITCNGEYKAIGGDASNLQCKHDYAHAMKHTNYMGGMYNSDNIKVREYNHCFNCGHSNNETVKVYA